MIIYDISFQIAQLERAKAEIQAQVDEVSQTEIEILDEQRKKKNLLERDFHLWPPDWRAGALPTELTKPFIGGLPILSISLFGGCQKLKFKDFWIFWISHNLTVFFCMAVKVIRTLIQWDWGLSAPCMSYWGLLLSDHQYGRDSALCLTYFFSWCAYAQDISSNHWLAEVHARIVA